MVVAPDEGSTKRCTSVANDLNLEFAMINNRKPKSKGHNKNHRRKRKKSSTHSLRSQKSSERELEPSESDTKENNENGLPDHHPKHYLAKRSHLVPGLNRQISVAGSVAGRNVILIDDMIDTGHTLKEAIEVKAIWKRIRQLSKNQKFGTYIRIRRQRKHCYRAHSRIQLLFISGLLSKKVTQTCFVRKDKTSDNPISHFLLTDSS